MITEGPIVVQPVRSWLDRRRFQRLPWRLYAGDANWIPPLLGRERELLGWGRHPFFDHAEITTLLARRGGQVAGRLAVFINHVHNQRYREQRGFFGFLECVDDVAVARELFAAGAAWLRERGMTAWRGPVNPSQSYSCGVLVDSFDRPPCFLMTYNRPYYPALLEACGFTKAQDLYAYDADVSMLPALLERYQPAIDAAVRRNGVVIRALDGARFEAEVAMYLEVFNQALEGTWGFTPLQPREVHHIARGLRPLIVPEFTACAEVAGRPVGALLFLLDYNQVLRQLNGRLFPLGFWRLISGRRRITGLRAMMTALLPAYHRSGLGLLLLSRLAEPARQWGIQRAEFSRVLESNTLSRGSLERAGLKISKTYRIYDQAL